MTDKPAAAKQAPVTAEPDKQAEDPFGLARKLRAEAAAIEQAAAPDADVVRLKVSPPHLSFSYGGVDVGDEWTVVHSSLAPGVLRAADEADVTVTQEG